MRKHGLKALGLCFLAALSMMAVMATGAQAAEWKEAGAKIAVDLPIVGEADSGHWVLHATVTGILIEILCTVLAVTGGNLKANGTALATLKFSTCRALFNGKEEASCKVKEPIESEVLIEQFLHNSRDYLLFTPDNGKESFAIIEMPSCAIIEKLNVKGHAVVEDCQNIFRTEALRHLIKMASSTTLFTGAHLNDLRVGAASPALILGSEWIALANDKLWSGNSL